MNVEEIDLTVSDIKQFIYCKRVIYFTYCMNLIRPVTTKMELGKQAHSREEALQKRRKLVKYQLIEGKRYFNVRLRSNRLGMTGLLDMAIITHSEAIPVEFKMSSKGLTLNHKYQLTAYAMLLEDDFIRGKKAIDYDFELVVKKNLYVRRGFLHYIPNRKVYEIIITPHMREHVKGILADIRNIIFSEQMPDAKRLKNKCTDCEFRLFCNDID